MAGIGFPCAPGPWQATLEALSPDVIEAGDPYLTGWAALAAARALRVPAAAFRHSDLARLAQVRLGGLARRAAGLYVARLYDGSDVVLAPSACRIERLGGLGMTRVAYQGLGVDLDGFHPRFRDAAFKIALGLPADTRLLVFVGRNAPEKNLGVLTEAVERLGKCYHLLLVGPGMPASGRARSRGPSPGCLNAIWRRRGLPRAPPRSAGRGRRWCRG